MILMSIAPAPLWEQALDLAGRIHVIAVHFPIALLVSAAAAEIWVALQRRPTPSPIVRFCLWAGAASAVASGGLGWLHARAGFAGPLANALTITGLHRWFGTAAGLLAPVVVWLTERDARRGQRTALGRGCILVLAAIVGLAGHFGGLLTHGVRFFEL